MRGFAAIGLNRPKDPCNVGGVLRAAHCYHAALVAIAGDRSPNKQIRSPTNTTKMQRHIPVIRGANLADLVPFGAIPIAVDLLDDAIPLQEFKHPLSAFYIFGPEDGTLGKSITDWCPFKIMVPTAYCMNLAATVNVILYDRMAKQSMARGRIAA